jgi:LysR family transcriptional regulator of abg operon
VYLSQPALTRSIQQLEKHVGMPLLTRSTRSVSLTPAGERFYQYALLIVKECGDAKSGVADIQTGAAGSVTFGVGQFFSNVIVASAILRCRTQLPGVTVRTVSGTLEELTLLVRRSTIDFAFCSFVDLKSSQGLAVEPLTTLNDAIVASADHPLARERHPDRQALSSSRWAVVNRPYALDAHTNFFASQGLHVPRPVRTNSLALILSLVARRGFLAMLPREVVATDLRAGAVRILRTPTPALQRRVGLLHSDSDLQPAVTRVMQIVRDTCTTRSGTVNSTTKS